MCKQYSPAEFFPTKKTGTESLGAGTKTAYVPEVHNLSSMQKAIVLHAVARNPYNPKHRWNTSPSMPVIVPYTSAHMSHASQQRVSKRLNTASATDYVPTHRWNTSPPQTMLA
eukprot:9427267-Ditylum_brightwellii.AAC.1